MLNAHRGGTQALIDRDELRDRFARALEAMYRTELPRFAQLAQRVQDTHPAQGRAAPVGVTHGAIRLASARELLQVRRLFAVMGMHPVDYYDLSSAGLPVHSTAFRALSPEGIARAPFRMFTSLLRSELIADKALRNQIHALQSNRSIFPPGLLDLIQKAETHGGIGESDAPGFIRLAVDTFRWHGRCVTSETTYRRMLATHPLIADICCFPSPHINHLTVTTSAIDDVQNSMIQAAMAPKDSIEGPPKRNIPVLLRQTSFKAVPEPITFDSGDVSTHAARFGEVEQRGFALTPKGRTLYDQCLGHFLAGDRKAFDALPDDLEAMRQSQLLAGRYTLSSAPRPGTTRTTLQDLVDEGRVTFVPFTYEDFLPVSAAGIFRSNLGDSSRLAPEGKNDPEAFEDALGCELHWSMEMAASRQNASLTALRETLRQDGITLETTPCPN